MKRIGVLSVLFGLLTGCVRLPAGVEPVGSFELERYLGTWYEIARLDHSFERGMTRVSAQYSLREDGGVAVRNRGYLVAENKWKEALGKAYFAGTEDQGFLKVSFFGPFYGSYVVFTLDKAYGYAFVAGPSKDYLWLLARQPVIAQEVRDSFISEAASRGFAVDQLIWVDQTGQ